MKLGCSVLEIKPINGSNAKISKDKHGNKVESRKRKQKTDLMKKTATKQNREVLFHPICFKHPLDDIASRKQKKLENA